MEFITQHIDTSNVSMGIGLVTFVGIIVLSYYVYKNYYIGQPEDQVRGEGSENSEYKAYALMLLLAILVTYVVLVLYKSALVYRGSVTYLKDSFQ